jgi:hypothetical protein
MSSVLDQSMRTWWIGRHASLVERLASTSRSRSVAADVHRAVGCAAIRGDPARTAAICATLGVPVDPAWPSAVRWAWPGSSAKTAAVQLSVAAGRVQVRPTPGALGQLSTNRGTPSGVDDLSEHPCTAPLSCPAMRRRCLDNREREVRSARGSPGREFRTKREDGQSGR